MRRILSTLLLLVSFSVVSLVHAEENADCVRWLVSPVDNAGAPFLHVLPGRGVVVSASAQASFGEREDMFVASLDQHGQVRWTKRALGRYVRAVTGFGNGIFVTTEFSGDVRFDRVRLHAPGHTAGFVAKLDGDGATQWGRMLSTPDFTRMDAAAASEDGGAYVATGVFWGEQAGALAVDVAGGKDAVLVKTDRGGQVAWVRSFHWPGYDQASSLVRVGSDVVLAGTRWNAKSSYEYVRVDGWSHGWVTRLDPEGKTIWETALGRRMGQVTIERAVAGVDESIVVVGRYRGVNHVAETEIGSERAFGGYMAALDSNGRVTWVRTERAHELMAGNALWPEPSCVAVAPDGRIVAAGSRGVAQMTAQGTSWLLRFSEDDYVAIRDCGLDGHQLYISGSARRGAVLGGQRLQRRHPDGGWYEAWSQGFVGRIDLPDAAISESTGS